MSAISVLDGKLQNNAHGHLTLANVIAPLLAAEFGEWRDHLELVFTPSGVTLFPKTDLGCAMLDRMTRNEGLKQ